MFVGVGDQPLSLTTGLKTHLSHLLKEYDSLMEKANHPDVSFPPMGELLKKICVFSSECEAV